MERTAKIRGRKITGFALGLKVSAKLSTSPPIYLTGSTGYMWCKLWKLLTDINQHLIILDVIVLFVCDNLMYFRFLGCFFFKCRGATWKLAIGPNSGLFTVFYCWLMFEECPYKKSPNG